MRPRRAISDSEASAIRSALNPSGGIDPVLFGLVTPRPDDPSKPVYIRASMISLLGDVPALNSAPAAISVPFGFCSSRSDDAYIILDADACAPSDTRGYRMVPPSSDGNVIGSLVMSVAASAGPEDELKATHRYSYANAVVVRIPQSANIDCVVAVVFADDPPGTVHYGLASLDFGLSVAVREVLRPDPLGTFAVSQAVVVAVPETGIHRVLYCARMFPVTPGYEISYFARRPADSPLESLFKFPKVGSRNEHTGIYGATVSEAGPVHFPDARWSNMLTSSYSPGTEDGQGKVTIMTKGVRCVGHTVDPVFLGADGDGNVCVDLFGSIDNEGFAIVSGCSFTETSGPNAGRTCVGFAEPGSAKMGEWLHKPGAKEFFVRSFAGGGPGIFTAVSDWFQRLISTTRPFSAVLVYGMAGGRAYSSDAEVRRDNFTKDACGARWLVNRRLRVIYSDTVELAPVLSGPDPDGYFGMVRKIEDAVATSAFTFISVACHGSPDGRLCINGGMSPSLISSAIERGASRAGGQHRKVFILVSSCHSGDFFDGWAPAPNVSVLIWGATGKDNVAYGIGGTRVPWDGDLLDPDGDSGVKLGDTGREGYGGTAGVFLIGITKALMKARRELTYSQVFELAKDYVAENTAIREKEYDRMFGGSSKTRMHQVPDVDSNDSSFESALFMH